MIMLQRVPTLRKALGMKATDPTKSLNWYNAEMEDCATGYTSFIMELLEDAKQTCSDPVVMIEQRVDFSRWVEQGFGTADCIIWSYVKKKYKLNMNFSPQ